jgi:crotonobetainyl-CoA:carnitine CoA-transferase CaiB-like acyl-CoA transferase
LIIDLTTHSAAYAARLFAETGHRVVRVESPEGDLLRRTGPFLRNEPDLENGSYHQFLNAGKESLTLDLANASAMSVLRDLLAKSAALIANLPLPLDENAILEAQPGLVLTKVEDGDPEICVFARSGLLSLTGHPGARPVLLGGHVIYSATGLYVAAATAAALYVQQQSGQGQVVDVSVRQALETLNEQAMVTFVTTGKGTERRGYRGAVTAVSGAFPCSDGYWMISLPHTPEGWARFMDWVQDPVLMADKSLADEAERNEKQALILDRLELWSKRFPKAELVAEAQKRHIPASPVATALELADDPQLKARGFLTRMDHPRFGPMMFPQGAIATVRGANLRPAPTLGQHNGQILAELGYSEEDHRALVESGAM